MNSEQVVALCVISYTEEKDALRRFRPWDLVEKQSTR